MLVVAGVVLLYALAGPTMLEAVRSPAAWLGEITTYIVELLTLVSVLSQVGEILLRHLPAIVPPQSRFALLMAGCVLGLLWIATMRRLARSPQGVLRYEEDN